MCSARGSMGSTDATAARHVDRRFRLDMRRKRGGTIRGAVRLCICEKIKPERRRIDATTYARTGGGTSRHARRCGRRMDDTSSKRYFATPYGTLNIDFSFGIRSNICPDHQIYRHCPQRRHHLRHTPFALPRSVVAAARHMARRRQRSALHPNHDLRNLPLPGRPDAEHPRRRLRRRPARARIAAAAKKLDDLRRAWLNPPDLVDIVPRSAPPRPARRRAAIPTASCRKTPRPR